MQCNLCRNEAVIFQPSSGRHLCGRHLSLDIEARAKRAIRSHHWMESGDHIALILTGDKKSAALGIFFKKLLAGRHDIRLSTVPGEEGEAGGNAPTPVHRVAGIPANLCADNPATGRQEAAARDRPTKLAMAVTLDDIAREVLAEFLAGTAENLVHPPSVGTGGTRVICPFIAVTSEELELYADLQEPEQDFISSPCLKDPLSREVEAVFLDYHRHHPGTRFALLHLAEELSGGRVGGIAAAGYARAGHAHREGTGGGPCNDA